LGGRESCGGVRTGGIVSDIFRTALSSVVYLSVSLLCNNRVTLNSLALLTNLTNDPKHPNTPNKCNDPKHPNKLLELSE
jgi:hypothetical protein